MPLAAVTCDEILGYRERGLNKKLKEDAKVNHRVESGWLNSEVLGPFAKGLELSGISG